MKYWLLMFSQANITSAVNALDEYFKFRIEHRREKAKGFFFSIEGLMPSQCLH